MSFADSPATLAWLAAIAAAVWACCQFFLRREAEPGAELALDLSFVGTQQEQWLVEASATITNRGFVRHPYRDLEIVIRYLLPDDAIEDGDARIYHQLRCTRGINARVGGERRYFANASYIDPRLTFRHSYVTFIPADATFVWMQCRLIFMSWDPFPLRRRPR